MYIYNTSHISCALLINRQFKDNFPCELWIASLFGIAIYLIGVEYVDYKLQEKMNEIGGKNDIEPESLITIEQVSQKVAGVVGKIEETKEEVKL